MAHSLRHDLDGATPEEQAIHLALQREPKEVDLSGYATQKWVRAQGYLTSVPDTPSTPGEPGDINLDGYATEDFVKTHVGDTALVLSKNIQTVTMNLAEEAKSRRTGDQEVEDASVVRDELLSNKIEDEVKGNTAAHLVLESDIQNLSDVKYNKSGGTLTGPMTIRTTSGGNTRQLAVEAKDLGEQKQAFSVCGDGSVKAGYDANHPFIASARNDVVTKAYLDQTVATEAEDRAKGDEALAGQISDLQEGFDAAIIAGQEGAENINLELQSYLKKDDANTSFLKLTGGTMTGNLLSNALFKTTRNEGYAFQVRPDNGDTTVFIHTSGHIEASGHIKVDGTKVSLEDHTHNYLPLSGGQLTGALFSQNVVCERTTGYAFDINPGSGTRAYIHTDGSAKFKDSLKVNDTEVSLEGHTHEGDFAASNHNHDTKYVKGNWTISKSGGNWYIS